jgi:hypothetical protein
MNHLYLRCNMKIYRSICLLALLFAAPAIVAGCGGGSSSSSVVTSAALTFTNVNTNQDIDESPLNIRGVYPGDINQQSNFLTGSGVLSFVASDLRQGLKQFYQVVVSNKDGVNRVFYIGRFVDDPLNPTVGTVTDISGAINTLSISLYSERRGEASTGYRATSGTVTVVARRGKQVTLRLSDVQFIANSDTNLNFQVNGLISYNENDIQQQTTG